MDYHQILALVAAVTGSAGEEFAILKAGGIDSKAPIAQIACPRPFPVNEIEGTTMFCGTVQVPEDHAMPDGKKIPLAFTIMKSWSQYPEPDPLVYLQGGPGGSAFVILDKLGQTFEPWRKTRDVVFWDQRSAGISGHSVNCYNALAANALGIAKKEMTSTDISGGNKDSNTVSDCLKEIEEAGIDIAKYNTFQNAKDVRTITKALGYQAYNLYGISYGTKLALETMRVAPEGIRSVIIDGVAPPWIHLYDTLALKLSEPIDHVVAQCRSDETCNRAYPDLEKVIIETLCMAKAGKIVHQGKPVAPLTIFRPFDERNGHAANLSMTPYIPAFIYELYRGKEMPTVDMLVGRNFVMPEAGEAEVAAASATLPKRQRDLIQTLADNAAISQRVDRSNTNVMTELRDALEESRQYGPVAVLFDDELEKALLAAKASDPLSPKVKGSFAIIKRDAAASEASFFEGMYLFNYACQEDIPYNSYDGYQKYRDGMKYPYIGDAYDPLAQYFFGACISFNPQPRDNWQTPVVSDIPTLSIGGLYDSQTPASWAQVAVEKLSNAQVFMIPEAGHGAVLYQSCAADMGVAFTNDPQRKLSDACVDSIKVDWHFPDWVKTNK